MHRTTSHRWLAAFAAALTMILAACSTGGGASTPPSVGETVAPSEASSEPPAAAPPSPGAAASGSAAAATIAVASTNLGEIVVDDAGRTLYLFTRDTQGAGTSVCNDECAVNWPPLLVDGAATPTAAEGITGQLGTATRDDGTTQVTLNGWPLYTFAADAAPGDTNGQGVNDAWFAVSPAGEAVTGGSGTDEY